MVRPEGIALVLLALWTSACVTGDRLWRVTPFEGASGSDRVNVWPLAYHDGDATSVLWPLFDVDQHGFALRPIVAKDDGAYSVLFPLAAWDTDSGSGWAVPFYWSDARAGLFPLTNFGTLSWVGPVWWSERSSGLFPVAYFGSFSYVGPLWWKSGWWDSDDDGAHGGLFPIAMLGPTSYVGPAWWTEEGGSFGLLPLFGRDLFGSGIDHVGPLWWRTGREEDGEAGFEGGLFPLVSWGDRGRRFSLLPLYSHDLREDARTHNVLLGLGHRLRSAEKDESWLLPLYYSREEPGKADTALFPFFWKRTRGDEADVYTLLGNRAVDPASSSLNLYPLWWSNESAQASWKMLFPLFWFEREGDERTLITPLGGRGWSASGDVDERDVAFVNVLGPLYHHSRSRRRDEERTAFLWPLFERRRRGEEQTTRLAGLYTRTSSPEEAETSWALGLGHAERTATGRSHRLWPLYSWSNDEELPGPFYRLALYQRREDESSTRQGLFPLFSRSEWPSGSEWNLLVALVHHDAERSGRSSHTWAWPLFSRSRGDRAGLMDRATLLGSARWEGGRYRQLGAGLVHSSSVKETAEAREQKSRTLLFLTHESEERLGESAHVPAPEPDSAANRTRHDARGFLFDAFLSERDTYRVWRADVLSADEARTLHAYSLERAQAGPPDRAATRAVLETHGIATADDDPESVRRALAGFAAENTGSRERRRLRIPLVFGYESAHGPDGSDAELEWSGPLGLVQYERDAERRRLRLLYYGYRSETEAGRTSRDIFPFVTWDSGPDETRVSFLWRLFRYERRGERRGGHVLFLPWGET